MEDVRVGFEFAKSEAFFRMELIFTGNAPNPGESPNLRFDSLARTRALLRRRGLSPRVSLQISYRECLLLILQHTVESAYLFCQSNHVISHAGYFHNLGVCMATNWNPSHIIATTIIHLHTALPCA